MCFEGTMVFLDYSSFLSSFFLLLVDVRLKKVIGTSISVDVELLFV